MKLLGAYVMPYVMRTRNECSYSIMATVSNCSEAAVKAAGTLCYVLKQEQLDVIVQFALGKDVFAVLPTGYGKSLCYECLPKVFNEINKANTAIVIVLSPLIAIMKDQV